MKTFVFLGVSLDGYIARIDGSLDFLDSYQDGNEDYGYSDFIKNIDVILMGRKTFEKVISFDEWPYSIPVYVATNKGIVIPEKLKNICHTIGGSPSEIINIFKTKNFKNIYIDGGITIQAFLLENLIDEITISRLPVLIGDGIPLFSKNQKEIHFIHKETIVYKNGIIKSLYEKKYR
jgi:dihydrofolate reductase